MKKILALGAAVVLAAGLTTAASAQDLSFVGNAEYAFEAETFSTDFGVQYDVNNWTFVGLLNVEDTNTTDLSFTGLELSGAYAVNANIDLYAKLETDEDLNYEETTIGTAFKF